MQLDMNKILSKKVVFFGFDDTLCLHLTVNTDTEYNDEFVKAIRNSDIDFLLNTDRQLPNRVLQWLVKTLDKHGIKSGCLTWASEGNINNIKKRFLEVYYSEISEYKNVSEFKDKVPYIICYCKRNNLSLDDVMLIDTNTNVIRACEDCGIDAINPLALVTYLQEVVDLNMR